MLSIPARAKPQELATEADVLKVLEGKAAVLFLGHGAKGQYADLYDVRSSVDVIVQRLDRTYGSGGWVAVFGGDNYNPEKPDVAYVLKYLKEKHGTKLFAVQSDIVVPWGGVDSHVDYVHYVPTDQAPVLDAAGNAVIENGKAKMTTFWGGFAGGEAKGPTKFYLGRAFTEGAHPVLKEVVAIGSGPIGKQEALYARARGIPLTVARAETKHPEVNGKYGPLDDWVVREVGYSPGHMPITFRPREFPATPAGYLRLPKPAEVQVSDGYFLAPNEQFPRDAHVVFEKAKPGLLVGPGSERMLFDAILAPEATHVLVLDIDDAIIRFHRLNTALLKAVPPKARQEYTNLRLHADRAAWEQAAQSERLSKAERELLEAPESFKWWEQHIRQTPPHSTFGWENFYREPKGPPSPFDKVNYLYDDNAFRRVQTLAVGDCIQAHRLDLGDPDQVRQVVHEAKRNGLRLSALDLSNAWQSEFPNSYLGSYRAGRLLEAFDQIADDDSLVIATMGQRPRPLQPPEILYQARTYKQARIRAQTRSDWNGQLLGFEDVVNQIEDDFSNMREGNTIMNSCFARAFVKGR